MLVFLAALFFLGARMSHELHDDAGAFGGIGCALAHDSKVCGLLGNGNTAFRVEFVMCEVQCAKCGKGGSFFEG